MSILAQADLATAVSAATIRCGPGSADMSETTVPSSVRLLTLPCERVLAADSSSEFSTLATFGCLGEQTP